MRGFTFKDFLEKNGYEQFRTDLLASLDLNKETV